MTHDLNVIARVKPEATFYFSSKSHWIGNAPGSDVNGYDCVFPGTPNWFKTFTPPVLCFLCRVDLSGKTIIPFCTHDGGGFGRNELDTAKDYPKSKMLPGLAGMGDFEPQQVVDWLKRIGVHI